MLGFFFSHSTRLAQMRSGPLTPYIEALAERLHGERYHYYSARFILGQVGDCNQIFGWRGVGVGDLSVELFEEYRRHAESISPCRGLANSLDHLLWHLRADGTLPPKALTTNDSAFAQLLGSYATWMREVQGLAESTIASRYSLSERFLCWLIKCNETGDLRSATAADALDYIRECKLNRTQVSDLRQLCRYLFGEEITEVDLSIGFPRMRRVRLAREPKHIEWEDVERLLSATDPSTPMGLRDRAIVMLSAQLGLRNQEVRRLRLENLDWRRGMVRIVESKGGKSRELPLPELTGEAVAEYLRHGRPSSTYREVFLSHRAPMRPFETASAVNAIIRHLAQKAGVELPQKGLNILRHSLATHLVNNEVSIKAIPDLLGHASIDTTAIYTLVDMNTLSRVAQPFPAEVAK